MDGIFRDVVYVQSLVALNGNLSAWYSGDSGHFILPQRLILLWDSKEKSLGSYYLLMKTRRLFIAFVHPQAHTRRYA